MPTLRVPPSGRDRCRTRAAVAVAVLGASALPAALGPAMGHAAAPAHRPPPFEARAQDAGPTPFQAAPFARTAPVPAKPVPSAIEAFSPWLPQVSCDPVAKPGVRAFAALTLATWGRGHTASLARGCTAGGGSEHMEGRAWDWGLNPTDYTDVVAGYRAISWLLADDAVNARRVGIMYIIWNKRIWSSYRRAEGWRPYSGYDPHTSHVHFSFSWAGAMKRTSWWTGAVARTEYGPCILVAGEMAPPYGDTVNHAPCPKPKPAAEARTVSAQDTSTSSATSSTSTGSASSRRGRFLPAPAP